MLPAGIVLGIQGGRSQDGMALAGPDPWRDAPQPGPNARDSMPSGASWRSDPAVRLDTGRRRRWAFREEGGTTLGEVVREHGHGNGSPTLERAFDPSSPPEDVEGEAAWPLPVCTGLMKEPRGSGGRWQSLPGRALRDPLVPLAVSDQPEPPPSHPPNRGTGDGESITPGMDRRGHSDPPPSRNLRRRPGYRVARAADGAEPSELLSVERLPGGCRWCRMLVSPGPGERWSTRPCGLLPNRPDSSSAR